MTEQVTDSSLEQFIDENLPELKKKRDTDL